MTMPNKLVFDIIKEELLEIKEKYGDERLTKIVAAEGEFNVEDLIKDEIRLGISQCTEEITIESLELGYKKELRLLYVELKAFGPDGERYDTSVELLT